MTEEKKNRIGYLPEERGLYQDIPLERCLVYLSTLKGMDETEAKTGWMNTWNGLTWVMAQEEGQRTQQRDAAESPVDHYPGPQT